MLKWILKKSPFKNLTPSLIDIPINFVAPVLHTMGSLSLWESPSDQGNDTRIMTSISRKNSAPSEGTTYNVKGQGGACWPDSQEDNEEQQCCQML